MNGLPSMNGSVLASDEVIRIRKYPNRRLYDTSRSRHLTHDGVVALIAEGRAIQVTDSRSGTDITNVVLLQIMIERDPGKLVAIPTQLVHRAMRSDAASLKAAAELAAVAWQSGSDHGRMNAGIATSNGHGHAKVRATPSAGPVRPSVHATSIDANGRPKAKAKRLDGV